MAAERSSTDWNTFNGKQLQRSRGVMAAERTKGPVVRPGNASLQRSRGVMAAESLSRRSRSVARAPASTEPRRDGRGEDTDAFGAICFTKASTEPRRDGRGEAAIRGCMPVK